MAMSTSDAKEHILMLPFMAQGHLRPFLELALLLKVRTCLNITILTTPLNANDLRHKLSHIHTNTSMISIVDLSFDSTQHGLPPNVENTDKLLNPADRVNLLIKASVTLETQLHLYISRCETPPVCIIFDYLMAWAAPVAKSFGSLPFCFTTSCAYGTAAFLSFWKHLPHQSCVSNYGDGDGDGDDESFCMPGFPASHCFRASHLNVVYRNADGSDELSRYFQHHIRLLEEHCSGWICNSVEELEPIGFDIFREYVKLPVWAVGPVISSLVHNNNDCNPDTHDECIQWLGTQKHDSVLYISFGSQNTITSTDMMELASGLELSGRPFVWVIRPPLGTNRGGESMHEWLPEGFEERMRQKKQGILVRKWGPQLEILRHPSTGGFLSHCGWNSVLESLHEGVPIIGLPLGAEQIYNLTMLREEMGVAIEFAGKFCKEEVKRVVEVVLDRKEGSYGCKMKNNAVKMMNILTDSLRETDHYKGSSLKAMHDFVNVILSAACI